MPTPTSWRPPTCGRDGRPKAMRIACPGSGRSTAGTRGCSTAWPSAPWRWGRHRPRGQKSPFVESFEWGRPNPPGGVRPGDPAGDDGRMRGTCPSVVSQRHRDRRARAGQRHGRPGATPAVGGDLQRRHGGAAGVVRAALPTHGRDARLERRRLRPGGGASRRPGLPWRQHDLGPPRDRLPRSGQPGVGPTLGGVRRISPPGALPHRFQPVTDGLLREVLLAVAARVCQAGHRRLHAVPRKRTGDDQHASLPASSTATRS